VALKGRLKESYKLRVKVACCVGIFILKNDKFTQMLYAELARILVGESERRHVKQ
jgi:hypothetical protein